MTDTTTVRVQLSTRDELNAEVEASGSTADAVIRAGLKQLRRERLRRAIERDAHRLANDDDDKAEIAEVMRDVYGDPE